VRLHWNTQSGNYVNAWIVFVILTLAAWRIGNLIHYERGPLAIFQRFREAFGVSHDEDGEPIAWPDTEIGKLLSCLDCGTIWVGIGLVVFYLSAGKMAVYVALLFALSAAAIIIGATLNGKSRH